ncbi:MAG: PDZ domain-containing protein [Clostridia bacterium]|nr:PDZ domain-containing protein [Clostridia bacterium]
MLAFRLRKRNSSKTFLVVAILLFFALLFSRQALAEPSIDEVKSWLENNYVEKIDWSKIDDSSLESIFKSLNDPYTSYLTPKELEGFMTSLGGSFGGIGIYIEQVEGYVTITAPIKGSPADKAGLKPQDKIVRVNGLDVINVPMSQVVELIRGVPGTEVEIIVLRGNQELNFSVIRGLIEIKSVEGELIDGNIGYIKLSMFGEKTAMELREILNLLDGKGALGYILDLRYNGGGYLDTALDIADILLPKGKPILHVVDRSEHQQTYRANESRPGRMVFWIGPELGVENSYKGIEKSLVVLVNKGSASAAEILAAAIKENGAGVVVGTETFGKASVQQLVNLKDGGVLKMTTAYYLTPMGNNINGRGLIPNVYIEDDDQQLAEATEILTKWLRNKHKDLFSPAITLFVGEHKSFVKGKEIAMAAAPFVEGGRTYVPIRFVSEGLGLEVNWNENKQEITIRRDKGTITMKPNSNIAVIGNEQYTFDAPVIIKGSRSYLPIRFLIQLIEGKIDWIEDKKQIDIWY